MPGIKVEEITGYEQKSGRVWVELAKQIYNENGVGGYRTISHYESGAPYLEGEAVRISVSHTEHILVVASLAKTPEIDLSEYNPRTALGVDVESAEREQVIRLRERFLNTEELAMVSADDLEANILAWTAKEALYKAALTAGLDFRTQILITSLPDIETEKEGRAVVKFDDKNCADFLLHSYKSENYIVTLAYSPKCATFKKSK